MSRAGYAQHLEQCLPHSKLHGIASFKNKQKKPQTINLRERQSMRMHMSEAGQSEKEIENLKPAPCPAGNPTWGSISHP